MGSKERPRPWFELDASFLTRGSVETLLDGYGPAGALAILALVCEAHLAIGGGKREGIDVVEWRYGYLARRIRIETDAARAIVRQAADIELVELLEEDGERFRVRLLRFHEWHAKDPGGARRQRNYRARNAEAERHA